MSGTTFTPNVTLITSAYLNDVNNFTYNGTIPTSASVKPSTSGLIPVSTSPTAFTWQPVSSLLPVAGNGLVSNNSGTLTGRTLTGTVNKIDITNGDGISGNPIATISATYIGQSSITTLGTIATGTWNGSIIPSQYGGTGINNSNTITLGGNLNTASSLTTSGINALTLTTTATTNSTLPSGTTTLVPTTGTGATGTWGISVTGNAGTVTTNANLTGDVTSVGNATTYNNTVPVTKGGTGLTTLTTAYGLVTAGTTATGNLQNAGTGTSAQVLLSQGSAALPTWNSLSGAITTTSSGVTSYSGTVPINKGGTGQTSLTALGILYVSAGGAVSPLIGGSDFVVFDHTLTPTTIANTRIIGSVTNQKFTTTGTYTPTTGMIYCIAEAVGGGGGGGSVSPSATTAGGAGGGGGGGYGRVLLTAAQIGASKAVTIGAAGTGGAPGNSGGNGGATSLGVLLQVGGGGGGQGTTGSTTATSAAGGSSGTTTTGDVLMNGQIGGQGYSQGGASNIAVGGVGGSSLLGSGSQVTIGGGGGTTSGISAGNYGAGGGGAAGGGTSSTGSGGNGSGGIIIITEFIAPAL